MAFQRAIYYSDVKPIIGTRQSIDKDVLPLLFAGETLQPDTPCFRFTQSRLLEVYRRIEIEFRYPAFKRTRGRREFIMRDATWSVHPGQALRPRWRWATEAELFHISQFSNGVPQHFRKYGNRWRAHIVETHGDILSMVRQLTRHVPASQTGKRYRIGYDWLISSGETAALRFIIESIARLIVDLASGDQITQNNVSKAIYKGKQLAQPLARSPIGDKVIARKKLLSLSKIEPKNIIYVLAEVIQLLSDRENEVRAEIATNEVRNGKRILATATKIKDGIKDAVRRLNSLDRELDLLLRADTIDQKALNRIARQAQNTWCFLIRVATFNPYYDIVHQQNVRRLSRTTQHAHDGDAIMVSNDIKLSLNSLDRIVRGDEPSMDEINRMSKRLSVAGRALTK